MSFAHIFRPSICDEEIWRSMLFMHGEVVQFTVLFRSLRGKKTSLSLKMKGKNFALDQ